MAQTKRGRPRYKRIPRQEAAKVRTLALRVEIVCEDRNGLEHVEAVLRLQRAPFHPASRAPREAFDRGALLREIARMLRDGPMTCPELADRVHEAHGFTRRRTEECVRGRRGRMRRAGWVRLEGGLWGLNGPSTNIALSGDAASSCSS